MKYIEQLSLVAKTHPHAAYAAYTHGPSIMGRDDLDDHMRRIMALPTALAVTAWTTGV